MIVAVTPGVNDSFFLNYQNAVQSVQNAVKMPTDSRMVCFIQLYLNLMMMMIICFIILE